VRADQPRWSTPVTVTPNGGAPSDGGAVADVGREIASSKKCIHESRQLLGQLNIRIENPSLLVSLSYAAG